MGARCHLCIGLRCLRRPRGWLTPLGLEGPPPGDPYPSPVSDCARELGAGKSWGEGGGRVLGGVVGGGQSLGDGARTGPSCEGRGRGGGARGRDRGWGEDQGFDLWPQPGWGLRIQSGTHDLGQGTAVQVSAQERAVKGGGTLAPSGQDAHTPSLPEEVGGCTRVSEAAQSHDRPCRAGPRRSAPRTGGRGPRFRAGRRRPCRHRGSPERDWGSCAWGRGWEASLSLPWGFIFASLIRLQACPSPLFAGVCVCAHV